MLRGDWTQHPGVWAGGVSGDGTSLVPNKPRSGVLVYSSHPLLTQASAQLYSFSGFGLTPKFPLFFKFWKKQRVPQACKGLLRGPSARDRAEASDSGSHDSLKGCRVCRASGTGLELAEPFFGAERFFPYLFMADATSRGGVASGPPERLAPPEPKVARFKSCPSSWRCSSRSTNFASLSGIVLGRGTLEEGGHGRSRPGWEFRFRVSGLGFRVLSWNPTP